MRERGRIFLWVCGFFAFALIFNGIDGLIHLSLSKFFQLPFGIFFAFVTMKLRRKREGQGPHHRQSPRPDIASPPMAPVRFEPDPLPYPTSESAKRKVVGVATEQSAEHSASSRLPLVSVAFRDPSSPDPLSDVLPWRTYTYKWPFPQKPNVGDWVIVDGYDGPTPAVIAFLGIPDGKDDAPPYDQLSAVNSPMSAYDLQQFIERKFSARQSWFDDARFVAGLSSVKIRRVPNADFPSLAGRNEMECVRDAKQAKINGNTWWRLYSRAEEAGLSNEEVTAFKRMAEEWYSLNHELAYSRDFGSKS